jgi:hypothetical protein
VNFKGTKPARKRQMLGAVNVLVAKEHDFMGQKRRTNVANHGVIQVFAQINTQQFSANRRRQRANFKASKLAGWHMDGHDVVSPRSLFERDRILHLAFGKPHQS